MNDSQTHASKLARCLTRPAVEAGDTLKRMGVTSIMQGRDARLEDLPGHPRLAHEFTERVRAASGVVFVIDATDFVRRKSEIARCVRCGGACSPA